MKFKQALVAASLALAAASASAVTVSGSTVNFSFDETFLSSLFGSYSVTGDVLSFSPTTFKAVETGTGYDIASATTPLITITAKSGNLLNGVNLFEQGDYFRIGGATLVSASGQFIVNDNPTSFTSGPLSNYQHGSDIALHGLTTTTWSVSQSASLGSAESATVKLQNILIAGSTGGLQAALIEKKLVSIGVDTTAVPVPAAFWLLASALAGLFTIGRRSNAA